ncbi:lysophospholipid acyltransferase family protein [bacterium]|nr:lysophospholipid acyltransferase family protein [bacterium]
MTAPIPPSILHQLEYCSLRAALAALGPIPPRWRMTVARGLAAALAAMPWRRAVLEENLRAALGDLDPARRRQIIRGVFRNTISLALELAWMNRIEPAAIVPTVDVDETSRERIETCRKAGRGVILACGHLGNWEWLAAWYAQAIGPMGVIYKPMHNGRTDDFITKLRGRFGLTAFSTRELNQRALVNSIKNGAVIGILSDQDARKNGRFVPFFGRPASTATGLATLAIRFGAPILPSFCLRTAGGRMRAVVGEPLWPNPDADRADEELRLLRGYHEALERAILIDPAQYFWWHRRWKTQPKHKTDDSAARA